MSESERLHCVEVKWTQAASKSAPGMETWDGSVNEGNVFLQITGPRENTGPRGALDDARWTWQAQHRANGWCMLHGEVNSRQEAEKVAARVVPFIITYLERKTDKSAKNFAEAWQAWLKANPSEAAA